MTRPLTVFPFQPPEHSMSTQDAMIELIAAELRVDPATIDVHRDFADYGLDSLALVDVMFLVEEHFGIDLPSTASHFRTLDELVRLVDERMPQAA